MNFIAFGFGVGSISEILGISVSLLLQAAPPGAGSCMGSASASVDVLAIE
jgi:hypothetical protein